MTDVLRSTTFQLEFKGEDGITGIRQFTRAVTDTDEAVDELSKTMGKNVEVTVKNVKSKKELTADARRQVAQMERTKSKMRELNRLYEHQSTVVNRTSDEQEVLNAVYKLGANATEKQQIEVAQLVNKYQQLRKETTKTQRGFRNLRGISQNLGWQLQDVAVQAQMGTSAFVIFSQQGSQMAGAFGPAGALIGALIAVGGALGGVALKSWEAKQGVGDLTKVTAELDKVFRQSSEGADLLSEKILKLAKRSKSLAKIEISQGIFTAQKQIKSAMKELGEIVDDVKLGNIGEGFIAAQISTGKSVDQILKSTKRLGDLGGTFFRQLEVSVRKVQDEYKITRDQAAILGVAMSRALDDKSILSMKTLENVLSDINQETGGTSKKLTEFASKFINLSSSVTNGTDRVNLLRMAFTDLQSAIDESEADDKPKVAKLSAIERLFNAEKNRLVKETETTSQEFDRRKKIIDDFVKFNKGGNKDTAAAFANLELWKTNQLAKEYNKREVLRRQIEKAQTVQLKRTDATGVEDNLFLNNIRVLNNQKKLLGEDELTEKKRIDDLIEQETARHRSKMDELNLESLKASVATFAMGSQQITSLADMMTNGVQQVEEATSEMNAGQKAAFIISQGIAAAMAVINGISLGGKLAEMFPLAAGPMLTLGTGLGVANAAAIGAVTFAGAFDKGGSFGANEMGIVSEFGDELVNGQLIRGPARVTSREDTAKMMSGDGQTKIIIENKIEGANYRTQRVDENTVKVIAEQIFSENIDSGVSSVLDNRNSKSTKSIKRQFNVRSQY